MREPAHKPRTAGQPTAYPRGTPGRRLPRSLPRSECQLPSQPRLVCANASARLYYHTAPSCMAASLQRALCSSSQQMRQMKLKFFFMSTLDRKKGAVPWRPCPYRLASGRGLTPFILGNRKEGYVGGLPTGLIKGAFQPLCHQTRREGRDSGVTGMGKRVPRSHGLRLHLVHVRPLGCPLG